MLKRILLVTLLAASPLFAKDATPQQRAEAMIDKATDYLKSKQLPDGAWHTGPQPPAISAVVLKALVQHPRYDHNTDFIKRGYERLLTHQLESGGIYRDMLANYNTAIAISALAAAENPEFKSRIDKAVAYLKSLQWNDRIEGGPKGEGKIDVGNPWYGGAGYGSKGRPDGSNTQMMIDALHDAGIPKDDPAYQAALKFVTRMQNLSETNDQKWAGNDGGAVYTPANNGESFAGEYKGPNGERMLRSYGSMTYAMLKTYIYAGLSKDDPRVKAAWDWISKNWTLDENPGMRANDPAAAHYGMYYYYLTLARALNAYNQPTIVDPQGNKHDWRIELIDKLTTLQKSDGSFVGEKKWMEDNANLITGFVVLSLQEALEDLKENPPK
jgi:squalene-hopene/tetraprenyl-beta-curcumene cyclase